MPLRAAQVAGARPDLRNNFADQQLSPEQRALYQRSSTDPLVNPSVDASRDVRDYTDDTTGIASDLAPTSKTVTGIKAKTPEEEQLVAKAIGDKATAAALAKADTRRMNQERAKQKLAPYEIPDILRPDDPAARKVYDTDKQAQQLRAEQFLAANNGANIDRIDAINKYLDAGAQSGLNMSDYFDTQRGITGTDTEKGMASRPR